MTERELMQILQSVDDALAVFRAQKGKLSVREISVKSMLLTLRTRLEELLAQERNGVKE